MAEEKPHLGVCNLCLIPCFYQDMPGGGQWCHEWPPNPQIEKWWKEGPYNHDADPGWTPVIPEEDVPGVHTAPDDA